MRFINIVYVVLGLLWIAFPGNAQDYDFRVMTTRGENSLQASSSETQNITVGTMMSNEQTIIMGPSSYLLLVSPGAEYVELTSEQGSRYKVEELDPLGSDRGTLLKRYSKFVMSKMTPEAIEENRKKYASITGATERGLEEIAVFMNTSANVLGSEAVVRWEYPKQDVAYKIHFRDMFEELLTTVESSESHVWVDLDQEMFKGKDLVTVTVTLSMDENVTSGTYSMQRMSESDAAAFYGEYSELVQSLENSPFSHLILAEFFEQNGLLLDALTSYEKAVSQSNGLDYFKNAYAGFLMRNGYTDRAF